MNFIIYKIYILQYYQNTIDKIRSYVENKKISVNLDETTYAEG